jgi:hypothetical protein
VQLKQEAAAAVRKQVYHVVVNHQQAQVPQHLARQLPPLLLPQVLLFPTYYGMLARSHIIAQFLLHA